MTRFQMIRRKYRTLKASLNERSRRMWAVTEAQALGYGGASLVARATGISRSTIVRGAQEVRSKSTRHILRQEDGEVIQKFMPRAI